MTQKDRVSEDIRTFLAGHSSCESPAIQYFYLLANTNCPKPTDTNFEFFDSNVIFENTSFQGNYLKKKVAQLCTEEVESVSMHEKWRYSIRTLLAWLVILNVNHINFAISYYSPRNWD